MELITSLCGVLGALLIGAISPGPSFVLVARTSMAASRIDGLFVSIGMGIGGMAFSVLAILGVRVVLAGVPWLYFALKLAGGLYLLYLAIRIWRGANKPMIVSDTRPGVRRSLKKSFLLGLLTQLSNPKTAIVYGGIFAALLPHDLPQTAIFVLPLLVFFVEAGWYSVVALTLSTRSSRAAYLKTRKYVDRFAGGVMGIVGLKLVAAAGPAQT